MMKVDDEDEVEVEERGEESKKKSHLPPCGVT